MLTPSRSTAWHPDGSVPFQLWANILEQFPNVDFKRVDMDLAQMVMRQGEEEIAVTRHAARIGDAM